MKNWKSLILNGLFLAIILVGAVFAYSELTKNYTPAAMLVGGTETGADTVQTDVSPATVPDTPAEETEAETTEETKAEEAPAEEEAPAATEAPASDRIPVPDFTVVDIDGNTVSLSDFAGKPVIINFWASWCDPCKMEMPYFHAAWETYGEEIQFLMVNLHEGFGDTMEDAQALLEEKGYGFPVYYDTESLAAMYYGVYSVPRTFFVDKNGNLFDAAIGSLPEEILNLYVEALLADAG